MQGHRGRAGTQSLRGVYATLRDRTPSFTIHSLLLGFVPYIVRFSQMLSQARDNPKAILPKGSLLCPDDAADIH